MKSNNNNASFSPWQVPINDSEKLTGFHRQGRENSERVHIIHGTGFSALTLKQMANHLPEDWHLWLTNVPGHGQSCQPKHIMPDWQDMASTIAKQMATVANIEKEGPVIGVGHSFGGVLTLLAASKYPHYFSRIVLLDPPIFISSLLFAQKVLRSTGLWQNVPWVKAVRKRTQCWPSKSLMREELKHKQLYKNWQPQVLDDFIESATVQTSDGQVRLACDPRWEANIFGSYPRKLWKSITKTSVHVDLVIAQNTYGFIKPAAKKASRQSRYIHRHYFGKNHCFPMEQPLETAQLITELVNSTQK